MDARRKETTLLREQKSAVEKQANEYQLRQADLNDQIRELERMLDTATKNNTDLRERVAKYTTLLQSNGLSTDIAQIKGLEAPPPVSGEVKQGRPDQQAASRSASAPTTAWSSATSCTSTAPSRAPSTWARVRSSRVDPDQAVVRVMGSTVQGKKIKEGDIVSSTIIPRF